MKLDISYNLHPTIDILIAVAERGGVENCINMLGRYLTDRGCHVRILQLVYEGTAWADECMEFHYVFPSRKGHNLQEFVEGYKQFMADNGAPDLTIATAWPMMSYVAKKAGSELGADNMVASWLHASLKRYETSGFGGGDYVRYADMHLAISDEIAGEIKATDGDAVIYRVNNPVDMTRTHCIENITPGTLLFVGRLSGEKNIGVILQALATSKTAWKLRLVGDGDERDALKKMACDIKIRDRVEFLGWSDDPWKYAEGAYALVLSSVYEGSPLVAIEALSCGLPVIANVSSRVSGIVAPGVNGYLYPDEKTEELAKILDYIAEGRFPAISSEECRASVESFSAPAALWDLYCKIRACVSGRMITDRLWGMSDELFIADKVSVIVPCYNAENYIRRCLDSILNQTIGLSHIEIIAVNDCSGDATADILREYENRYPDNICLIDCEINAGQSHARNIALEYASGQYITFVDADDSLAPDMLETLVLADKCYPSDIVSCGFATFDSMLPPDFGIPSKAHYKVIENTTELRQLFIDNAFITAPWGRLYRSEFLLSHEDLLFPEGYRMEDIYFTYMSVAYAGTWQLIPAKLYGYYQNPDGIMRSGRLKTYYMDVHHVFAMTMDRYRQLEIFKPLKQEIEFIYFKKVFRDLIGYIKNNDGTHSGENIHLLTDYINDNFTDITNNGYLDDDDREFLAGIVNK